MTPFFCSTRCCTNFAEQYLKRLRIPRGRTALALLAFTAASTAFATAAAAQTTAAAPATGVATPVYVFGIPVDFILFALTLVGVAIFHHKTLQVA
ncbi:MAG TPA: hypothetical protein VFO36_05560, partial [Nitrospiraceae bacterium]|nr:hypothetical protein [Nitrospiraceae bacterium]